MGKTVYNSRKVEEKENPPFSYPLSTTMVKQVSQRQQRLEVPYPPLPYPFKYTTE